MSRLRFRRIALFAKSDEQVTGPLVREVLATLTDAGCSIVIDERIARLAPEARSVPPENIAGESDLVMVIGGDGSLLAAARSIGWAPIPLLGVNLGRLGFLADIGPRALARELGHVLAGECRMERRLMLHLEVNGRKRESGDAVNDVVIKRLDGSRLLELQYWVGETFVSRTRADGLIVATPTGSTAYALSAGGPIIAPGLATFVVVPICPHGLGERPLVVPSTEAVRIRPTLETDERAEAILDGQTSIRLDRGAEAKIGRSERELLLLHPPRYEYFSTLREKLGWGGRNAEC